MTKALVLGISFCLLILTSCSPAGGGETNSPAAGLDGTYTACVPSQFTADYGQVVLTFSGSSFNSSTEYFDGIGCTGNSLGTELSSGTFSLSGSNFIDYAYNGGSTIYDIYEIDGSSSLKVGDRTGSEDGLSSANRPTTFSSSITYTRQ